MYELNRIEEILKTCLKLKEDITRINDAAFINYHAPQAGDGAYAARFGALEACADMAATRAGHALSAIAELRQKWELLERLQAVMELLEVYANIDTSQTENNTRELRLLEVVMKDKQYRFEAGEIREAISDAIRQAQSDEWDGEMSGTKDWITGQGFLPDPDGDGDVWVRGMERIVIEDEIISGSSDAYTFELTRAGVPVVSGRSGEFSKLVAHIAPVTVQSE